MAETQIKSVSIRHEAIIDTIVANPTISVTALAATFGVTVGWMSVIMHSEVFRDALAKKNEEVFNQVVVPTRARMTAVADQAYEKLAGKIPFIEDPKVLLEIADRTANKLGHGPKRGPDPLAPSGNTTINNTYIAVGKDALTEAREKLQAKTKEPIDVNKELPSPA